MPVCEVASVSWLHDQDRRGLGRTRSDVLSVLRTTGVDEECRERSLVVVDELVGNAVEHSGAMCVVEIRISPRTVVVAVHDPVPTTPRATWNPSGPARGGLTLAWQVSRNLYAESATVGKRVVAEIARWPRRRS